MSTGDTLEAAKRTVRATVNRLGFDVVRLRNSHGDLATHLNNVIANNRIDLVLDVGANAGQYGRFLRTSGYTGFIISFEPVRSAFEQLKAEAAGDDRWLCLDFALGDREESKKLNVYESTVFSSFLETNDYSKGIWKSLDSARAETVRVARLDAVFPELVQKTGASRTLLKMDTQGYDLNVFAGAKGMLTSVMALQSELSLIPVYENMPAATLVLDTFGAEGFRISGMYPINRDPRTLAVIEYDCVMVRHSSGNPK